MTSPRSSIRPAWPKRPLRDKAGRAGPTIEDASGWRARSAAATGGSPMPKGSREMIRTEASAEVGSFLDIGGIQTFFVERGDGEAVVLIHGAAPGACSLV